jgi:HAD superfamily hydrolase (TIGR01490 family)
MKRIVIFDFDNVIIRGQSQLYLVNYLIKQRKIQILIALQIYFWFFLKKIGFQISPYRIRNIAYKTFKGWTVEYFEDFFRKFNLEVIRDYCILDTHELIKNHIESKDEVIVVSASLKIIVKNCLSNLNIGCCIATELEIIDNKYTGIVKGIVPFAQEKCLVIEKYFKKKNYDWKSCIAYTDDFSDLELLNLVASPFVVNPDSKLREVAIKRGWEVYDF